MTISNALNLLKNQSQVRIDFDFETLENELNFGFSDLSSGASLDAQKLLAEIYKLHTIVPQPGAFSFEGDPAIARVRSMSENAFLRSLDATTSKMIPYDVPTEDFGDWLEFFIASHDAAKHPAYFDFLASKATAEDIRFYLVQESAIDGNTDDFLASLQIGSPRRSKLEIAANFWDEMGEGSEDGLHSELFLAALRSFGVSEGETKAALTVEALMCGNLQTMLSLRRENFYLGIGYFAATEQLVPERFAALKLGWERVGLPEDAAQYHLLHIEIDGHHTERWYREVVGPIGALGEQARRNILRGALFRLYTSDIYLSSLMTAFPSLSKDSAAI